MAIKTQVRRKRRLSSFSLLVIFGLSVFFVMSFINALNEQKRLEKNLAVIQQEVSVLKRTNESLNDQRTKLSDPEYMKEYARGNFMFSGDSEQIFILPSNQSDLANKEENKVEKNTTQATENETEPKESAIETTTDMQSKESEPTPPTSDTENVGDSELETTPKEGN